MQTCIALYSILLTLTLALLPVPGLTQVNSGSDGRDGMFSPAQNITIDMSDHPDGLYQYSSVIIPSGVTVTFIPNARNSPVIWLVQGNCEIEGTLDVSGKVSPNGMGAAGGPGGGAGGSGGTNPNRGYGPGGGEPAFYGGSNTGVYTGGNGSFALKARAGGQYWYQAESGDVYGNAYLLPLLGGSGGGGGLSFAASDGFGGSGGGGALLIASSTEIRINGFIISSGGGQPASAGYYGGGGSGGGIRLIAPTIAGSGQIVANGGTVPAATTAASAGRIRFDSLQNSFGGRISGEFSWGFQPIILPAPGQGIQLGITSIAGQTIATNPTGALLNPDVIIPPQQMNPVSVVVSCTNVPLNTGIAVVVHPATGADVLAVGLNNIGSQAASTATVSVNLPRGGGIIYAKAVTGIAGASVDGPNTENTRSLAKTGWTTDGERFVAIEVTAILGGKQQLAYLTESGKRYLSK